MILIEILAGIVLLFMLLGIVKEVTGWNWL